MVEAHCGPEEPQEVRPRKSCGGQREAMGKEATSNTRDRQTNTQKVKTDWTKTFSFPIWFTEECVILFFLLSCWPHVLLCCSAAAADGPGFNL